MKKAQVTFGLILSLIAFCLLPVQAEVALESNAGLIGVWNMDGSAINLNEERRPGQQTWEFKADGTLSMSGYDERLPGGDFSVSTSYEVKDGKIVADVVGLAGKKTTYTVIEKEANSMIIRQWIGEYMFFTKK
ncbi:MAG: hypothetical protein L0Y39_04175 [Methylococcaceae bacterium]|nr:hypothetical protein [Methylococcaceae bacterium]